MCLKGEAESCPGSRASGILLPVFSLPSSWGIGDFGPEAVRFLDFLVRAGQKYWQILPLHPTDPAFDHSPYHSLSVFALNPLLVSPDLLLHDGWIASTDLEVKPHSPEERVDYAKALALKTRLLDRAWRRYGQGTGVREYDRFVESNSAWLDDYALFIALKSKFRGRAWTAWPPPYRDRDLDILEKTRAELRGHIEKVKFLQYLVNSQWTTLKTDAERRGLKIIGDMPIYVVHDSADVWSHPGLFCLGSDKTPLSVAGVPPDYFSATGQRWGNPLYRWDVLKHRKYGWWLDRIGRGLELFDLVRIDHFRGFAGFWEIPAGEKTAVKGRWREGPGADLFEAIREAFPEMPFIAEDLGTITPDVRTLMDRFGLPGMKVLLFAFGDDDPDHPYLPHTYEQRCVVYTGTHDNNTVRGWFTEEAGPRDRERLFRYLKMTCGEENVSRELVRLAEESPAETAVIPLQDLMGLGGEARINIPGTRKGNWRWRISSRDLSDPLAGVAMELAAASGRLGS